MIEIAVVEDNDADAQLLAGHISRYGAEAGTAFRLTRYTSAEALLDHYSFSMKLKKAVGAARRTSTSYIAIAAPTG